MNGYEDDDGGTEDILLDMRYWWEHDRQDWLTYQMLQGTSLESCLGDFLNWYFSRDAVLHLRFPCSRVQACTYAMMRDLVHYELSTA